MIDLALALIMACNPVCVDLGPLPSMEPRQWRSGSGWVTVTEDHRMIYCECRDDSTSRKLTK